jgi:diguanylate cyclase (GGDEF)-like protein/PAS domain S-box-containing protein
LIDQPLKQIREKALEIAESDEVLGTQIPLPAGAELQELTAAFNTMSTSLKASHDETEARVAERTRLVEEGSRLVQEVLDTTPNMLCLMNTEIDQFNYLNREFCEFFGMQSDELIHLGPTFFRGRLYPNDRNIFTDHEKKITSTDDSTVVESDFRIVNHQGIWRWVGWRSIVFQRNRDGQPKLVLHVGQDITTLKETEEKLRFLSIHDQLTGLYNRLYFEEEMSRLERGRIFPISTIMTDVDNLKEMNDTYGHAQGDELLKLISGILRSSFRAEDVVARIGGDEFAALLPGTDESTAQKIITRIEEKIDAHNTRNPQFKLSLSIGVETSTRGESLTDALQKADTKMYASKMQKREMQNSYK